MAMARARHILVPYEDRALEIKSDIDAGEDFQEMAQKFSTCPSSKEGGDLGTFSPGEMVPEFDTIVFKEEVGPVHGPVKTEFGFHLIQIIMRAD